MENKIIKINEQISYLPSTRKPISSEVVFIKGSDCTWIFDTGLTKDAAEAINSIEGKKKVVISHWHPDPTLNLSRIICFKEYKKICLAWNSYRKRY